jgi:hypothetical protein
LEERDYFSEKDEVKVHSLACPSCRRTSEFKIRWRVRTKKKALPRNAGDDDRARFRAARDYMVRLDDVVQCPTPRCGKRIEISSLQSVVFL